MARPFKPALIVVDFQEDFCPPNGALAVPNAHDITGPVNYLLSLPFHLRLATRDWHPPSHISFAANHPNHPQPFTSTTPIIHPDDPSRSYDTILWPVHCVTGSHGAQLVPALDVARVHAVVDKGQVESTEMYSAFYDPFHVEDSGLAARLKAEGISHVFVVGLAADFCVKATAEHALDEGYETCIVDEGTRPVMPDKWPACRDDIVSKGVRIVSLEGDDVQRVEQLSS